MTLRNGAAFALDVPAHVEPVWGDGHDVLWARGEPLVLCGPQGVGKTTLDQQVAGRGDGPSSRLGPAPRPRATYSYGCPGPGARGEAGR